MPVMDGLEATAEIRKVNRDIPIIAVTAFALSDDRNRCINAGCTDYLTKPLIKEKLFTTIEKYI
jgi:CheY-like chemotaxis protein